MVQTIGVDGFRIDAAKHFPTNTLTLLDQAVFRASNRLNHDGTVKPVYSFSEVLDGNKGTVQNYIRRDLPNPLGDRPRQQHRGRQPRRARLSAVFCPAR